MTETCRVCGSRRVQPRFPSADPGLRLCRECGVIFREGAVGTEELRCIYDENYYRNTWPGSLGKFFSDFDPELHHKTKFMLRQLRELSRRCGGPGRILDVGCANGVFVWLAAREGWQAEGLEVSPFAAAWGRKQFGVKISEEDLHNISPDPGYDAITFWDTIEHLPDPAATLHAAFARLRPGGFVAVLTPDTDSLINHLVHSAHRLLPGRTRTLIEKLYHQDHLSFFNRGSMAQALLAAGFTINWMESYDEDPADTETAGLTRAALRLVGLAAALLQRRHELLVYAQRPAGRSGRREESKK